MSQGISVTPAWTVEQAAWYICQTLEFRGHSPAGIERQVPRILTAFTSDPITGEPVFTQADGRRLPPPAGIVGLLQPNARVGGRRHD